MPRTRNRLNGVIDSDTPQHIIDHEVLGKNLEIVGLDDKPLVPELASKKQAEKIAADSKRSDTKDKE